MQHSILASSLAAAGDNILSQNITSPVPKAQGFFVVVFSAKTLPFTHQFNLIYTNGFCE
jgi:hypothetical protein